MRPAPRFMREYRIVVVGSGAVGKSSLTIQFVQNQFVDIYDPTIEGAPLNVLPDAVQELMYLALVDVLDTAGQEDYSAMHTHWFRSGEAFLLVYSVTDRSSFDAATAFHQEIVRAKDSDTVPLVLAGNKCDLEYERQVTMNEGRTRAREYGCRFFETSAKQRINVQEAFFELVRAIRDHNRSMQKRRISQAVHIDTGVDDAHGGGCCRGPVGCVIC
ncbi:ras protein [Gloeopeniophorella convolvens]|nr:ras protein [Gloeopeniophorella convolvens]